MIVVNKQSGEILLDQDYSDGINQQQARTLTDKIKIGVEGVWHMIEEAYTSRAWAVLGYKSWDDYCTREFGTSRLRLPREDRPEVVASLRESGLSVRAIASATGVNRETIRQEIAGDKKLSPDLPKFADHMSAHHDALAGLSAAGSAGSQGGEGLDDGAATDESVGGRPAIKGTDGKTYPAKPKYPAKPRRRSPLPDQVMRAAYKLRKKAESINTLFEDDRLAQNKEQISLLSRSDLLYVQRVVAAALEQLPITEG